MTSYELVSADGAFTLSTDAARLDFAVIHDFLANRSYWAKGTSRERVERAAAHSLCFGIYENGSGRQVAYARVVTDYTTLAYLCDVFVLEEFRGRGLSKWLMASLLAHTNIESPRRWLLATADAHGLYRPFGFEPLPTPERWLVKLERL